MKLGLPASRHRLASARRIAVLAAALVVVAPAARAQGLFDFFEASPRQIVHAVEDAGYEIRGPLVRRGDVYICDAIGESGRRVRLVVDARSGQVIQRYAERRPAWSERDDFDAPPHHAHELEGGPSHWSDRDDDDQSRSQRVARGTLFDAPLPSANPDGTVIPGIGKPQAAPDAPQVAKPKPHSAKRHPAAPAASVAKTAPDAPASPATAEAPATMSPTDAPKPASSSVAAVAPSAPAAAAPDVAPVTPESRKPVAEPVKPPIDAAKPTEVKPAEVKPLAQAKPVSEAKPAVDVKPAAPAAHSSQKKLNDLPVSPLD